MAAVTSVGETPAPTAASRPRGMHARRRRPLNIFRYAVFTVFGLFFFLPLLVMLRYSVEESKLGTWSLTAWKEIASYQNTGIPPLPSAIEVTLELAVITSVVTLVMLVPTMIWIRLRVQWLERDDVLQPELYAISRSTPNAGVIFSTSFAALLFAFVLLLTLSYAGRIRRGRG